MSLAKTDETEQFGRIAVDGGAAVPPTIIAGADNQGKSMLVDQFGRPWVRVAGTIDQRVLLAHDLQGITPVVVTPAAANVFHIYTTAANNNSYFQIFDSLGVPVIDDIPVYSISNNNNDNEFLSVPGGSPFANGISIGWSGTAEKFDGNPGGTLDDYRARVVYL